MTLGEKIAKQRKEHSFTQDQLAEILGVSRQSVSKWESDIAYPETEKLIKLGKLFDCSMDYLLKEEITEKSGKQSVQAVQILETFHKTIKTQCREHKSEKMVCGMPLYHIGRDAKGLFAIGLKARGVFALGVRAKGVVSVGLLSAGGISIGLLSAGLISVGVLSAGLLSVGILALGFLALGAVSVGIVSFGALAIGGFSAGVMAVGKYIAYGDYAKAMIAIGESKALGSIYAFPYFSPANTACAIDWLDANVPGWLTTAKEIFKLYLS